MNCDVPGILLGDNTVVEPGELSSLGKRYDDNLRPHLTPHLCLSAHHAQQLFVATVPLMTVDAEEAADQETEDWRDFQDVMKRTLEITDNLVHRAMARETSQGLIADFYRAGMTEEEVSRTIGKL